MHLHAGKYDFGSRILLLAMFCAHLKGAVSRPVLNEEITKCPLNSEKHENNRLKL